jgi:nitroimidazol reductase NimA-like FMN-containing flavoprotein (pyridoxamine 5'-phosphate oxidase superfamily)
MPSSVAEPPSDRTRVRRGADNADYDPATVRAILDAGLVAHVGVVTERGPIVLPMAYGRTDTELFLHGAVANAMLRDGEDLDVCATITIVDGLVVARAPFHNTMRYRSVVVRGTAHRLEGEPKVDALRAVTDHVLENWDSGRTPTEQELRATLVLAVPLQEASAKIREGGPRDDVVDLDGPHWAGAVPIETRWAQLEPANDLDSAIAPPPAIAEAVGRRLG